MELATVPSGRQLGRGPDRAAIAVRALEDYAAALAAYRVLGAQLLAACDRLLETEDGAYRQAGVRVRVELERELASVLSIRRGSPLWDRPPAGP